MRSLVCKSINFEPMQSEVRIAVKKMSKDLNNEILISFISLLRAVVSVPDNSPELQKECSSPAENCLHTQGSIRQRLVVSW